MELYIIYRETSIIVYISQVCILDSFISSCTAQCYNRSASYSACYATAVEIVIVVGMFIELACDCRVLLSTQEGHIFTEGKLKAYS